MNNAAVDDMRKMAQSFGMVTLREAGMAYAFDGTTTLDEIVRETIMEA
jgi:type IV pilus assembly protein PilB